MGMTGKISRFLALAGVVLGLVPAVAAAQGTTISGQVTGTGGTPVVGASVSIAALRVGGFTDDQGRYSFTVPETATGTTVTLLARRLGFQPSSAQVTLTGAPVVQNFSLSTAVTELQGVVVTALGMTREKSTLGTAQQQLSNTELNQTRQQNVVQQIQGKVSGVQITGAGTQGGTTNIVIRGQNSLTSNNQPLFVVDGVPVSNSSKGGNIIDGYDFGSAINDLNPDDIATFSVLKGPNAAAIYGSRAANGVIVITTKKGQTSSGRIQTEISSNLTFERPSILPEWQNGYGQGAIGQFRFVNGAGGGRFDGADQSWGPKLDGRTTGCTVIPGTSTYDTSAPCLQFTSPNAASPWIAHPDNVERFFNTGRTLSTTVSMSGGTERANARVSIGADNVNGIFPNNVFQRRTALLSGTLRATDRLSADATLQYIRNTGRNRPGTGYLNSTLEQFFWFGRQVDSKALENYSQGALVNSTSAFASREYNWNYNYHNNPYWIAYENPIFDSRDRVIGSLSANYKLLDWLNLTARTGSDIYRLNVDQQWARGNLTNANQAFNGAFEFINDYRNDNTSDLLLTADRDIGSRVRFNGLLGGGRRFEHYTSNSQATAGISVPGIYNVSNAAISPTLGQTLERRQVNSLYGSAAFTLNHWWTVEGTARNDWSSTLPAGENSYFYPSVNTSIVVTDAMPSLQGGILSYLKVRGSVAQVGNDAPPYRLATTYVGDANKFSGLPQFSLANRLENAELKPEITRSDEGGIEMGLFNGRVTLDASLYNKTTRNQIFNVTVSPTSGFTSKSINAGRINNRGFEALLTLAPLQMDNGFNWTTTFNYTQNKSKVAELAPGIETIVLGQGIFAEVNIEARAGLPYGTIYGSYLERDAQGRLLTSGGLPIAASGFKVLGNIQPQWIGGIGNQFSYRGLSLNVLFDIKHGGKLVSQTNEVGEYSGVLASTLRGREVEWNSPGVVMDGIDIDTGLPNTINVRSERYFQSFFPTIEPYVYDASYVKLRELRLGFDVPTRIASRFGMQSVGLALTGRNLKTWTDVPNIDPEFAYDASNNQGIEYAIPSNPRSIGLSFRLTP
jgi:TonB-linked SusC/RagA family outer membrane protein